METCVFRMVLRNSKRITDNVSVKTKSHKTYADTSLQQRARVSIYTSFQYLLVVIFLTIIIENSHMDFNK